MQSSGGSGARYAVVAEGLAGGSRIEPGRPRSRSLPAECLELMQGESGAPASRRAANSVSHDQCGVTAILAAPARKRKRAIRSYLLTGLLRCGRCGTAMVATPRQTKTGGGRRAVYVYSKGATQRAHGCAKTTGGCGGVFILAKGVDAFVSEAVLYRLRGVKLGQARRRLAGVADSDKLMREIADDEAMLNELGEGYAERRISRPAFHAAVERVEGRLEAARAQLATRARPDVLDGIEDLGAEWSRLSLERQRAVTAEQVRSGTDRLPLACIAARG